MNRLRAWFLAPTWAVILTLFLAPLAIILAYSFLTRGTYGGISLPWTRESYQRLVDPIYLAILWRSFWIAGASTGFCLLLGFPLALFISRSGKRKDLYLSLVMLPFWTSFLIRTYAWMFLLRDTGLINTVLDKLGLIHGPLPLLYNNGAVILGLVYGYRPFMVLPLYATLERMDQNLLEASADLGARPWATLVHVMLPLSAPGIRAGAILVFIPCLGAYLTPDLLGAESR
jgi:spermidine/putrescine transport system permease protein